METPWVRGTKVLLNDLDHMTKRAAKPIYGNIYNLLVLIQNARFCCPLTSLLLVLSYQMDTSTPATCQKQLKQFLFVNLM